LPQGDVDPVAQVGIALTRGQAQEVSLAQHGGDQRGDPALAHLAALEDEMRERGCWPSRAMARP
jgi:hypothetical protein